jgi:hypothetical protein
MPTDDLGPMPEPQIDPGEPNPGGVDAVQEIEGSPTIPNLPSEKNPAVTDTALDEMKEGEDTSTQATQDDTEPMSGEEESPA